jgi:hypothetical protein
MRRAIGRRRALQMMTPALACSVELITVDSQLHPVHGRRPGRRRERRNPPGRGGVFRPARRRQSGQAVAACRPLQHDPDLGSRRRRSDRADLRERHEHRPLDPPPDGRVIAEPVPTHKPRCAPIVGRVTAWRRVIRHSSERWPPRAHQHRPCPRRDRPVTRLIQTKVYAAGNQAAPMLFDGWWAGDVPRPPTRSAREDGMSRGGHARRPPDPRMQVPR